VNPTIPVCFWCGKEKNEIALLGRLKGDAEAPRNIVLDYEPCDECKANMALGVTVMEATSGPNQRSSVEIQKGICPTGRWVVITHDAAQRIFGDMKSEKVFVDPELFARFDL
jgi:hypothetical protein